MTSTQTTAFRPPMAQKIIETIPLASTKIQVWSELTAMEKERLGALGGGFEYLNFKIDKNRILANF